MMSQLSRLPHTCAALLALALLGPTVPVSALAADADRDGFDDRVDLCPQHPDPAQADSDNDGYGNACDADYNDDGVVGNPDFARFAQAFGSRRGDEYYDPQIDSNADGVIGNPDFAAFRSLFGGPPGPGAAPIEPDEAPAPTFELHEEVLANVQSNVDLASRTKTVLGDQVLSSFQDFASTSDTSYLQPDEQVMVPINQAQFHLRMVLIKEHYSGGMIVSNCAPNTPCEFPAIYDTQSEWVYLIWEFWSAADRANVQTYVDGDEGREFVMIVDGQKLTRAADLQSPGDFRVYFPTSGNQMVTPVRKDAWYPSTMPWSSWHVAIQLWGDPDEGEVPIWDFDPWGNPIFLGLGPLPNKKTGERAGIVVPKPAVQSFFSATIGATVVSERCTTCHEMDTETKIEDRHNGIIDGWLITQEPSLLVAGQTVNHCSNCHEDHLPYLGLSSSFPESIWATPTPSMDIDWAQIMNDHPYTWPSEICNRMVSNMPTPAIRAQHFHEDARLFWAVAKGELPGPIGGDLPRATPFVYSKFIDRFDAWNASGAVCP